MKHTVRGNTAVPDLIASKDMPRGSFGQIIDATNYHRYTSAYIMHTYNGWMILSDPLTGFWSKDSQPPFMVRVLKKGEQITITIGEES